jgi:four helix bundle protein
VAAGALQTLRGAGRGTATTTKDVHGIEHVADAVAVNDHVNVNVNVNVNVLGGATRGVVGRYLSMLSFQRLDVYRCSVEFLAFAHGLSSEASRGNASMFDQLKRAATSVPLNIAEASGRTGNADAARAYAIARGSAMECAAVLDALLAITVVTPSDHSRGLDLLSRMVAMLTKLCR